MKHCKSSYLLVVLSIITVLVIQSTLPMSAQTQNKENNSTTSSGKDTEAISPHDMANDSLKGSLRLSAEMQFQTGNLDRFMFRGNASGELRNNSFAAMSSLSYSLQNIFGQSLENDWFGFIDMKALPNNTVYPMGFVEFETSQLRFLQLRLQGGIGAGVNIARSQAVNLSLSAAFTYDQTRFRIASSYEGWRYSFHLQGRYVLADGKIVLTHNLCELRVRN